MMTERKKYLDIIRYFCAVWIAFCHFIYFYDYFAFEAMYDFPLNIIFCGVTGKLALSMMVIILGLFASKPREKGIVRYSIERYFQFFLSALVINSIVCLVSKIGLISREHYSLGYILLSSLKIDASIFPEFWVMRHLLYGSIICFINSKLFNKKYYPYVLTFEILFLFFTQKYWILICVLGSTVNYLKQFEKVSNILKSRVLKIALIILILFVIRQKESEIMYLVDGICSFILIMIITNSTRIQKIIEYINIPNFFTKNYLGLFLVHPLVYEIYIYKFHIKTVPILDFIFFFLLSSIAAYIVNLIISILFKAIKSMFNKLNKTLIIKR